MVWDAPIALYLFLAGGGAGLFFFAAFSPRTAEHRGFRLWSHLIALAMVGVGLALLMVDARGGLFHPWRFVFLLTNFSSVMTWGVVFLAAFCVVDLAALALDFFKKNPPRTLDIVGCICSVCVAAYTGVLLGAANAAYPLWDPVFLPLLFLVSAGGAGAAVADLVAVACNAPETATSKTERAHRMLPYAEIVLLVVLLGIVSLSPAGAQSVEALTRGSYAAAFWIFLVIVGLVLPACLQASTALRRNSIATVAANTSALIGGLTLRLLIVLAAVPVTLPALGL